MHHINPYVCYPPQSQRFWNQIYAHYYWQHNPDYCTYCGQPYSVCCCDKPLTYMKLPQELLADAATPSRDAFIGGLEQASLTLEYIKAGASPQVKVTITEQGQTATWNITTVPEGYQIKDSFATLEPGAEVKLEVTDCTARLRWCEMVSC